MGGADEAPALVRPGQPRTLAYGDSLRRDLRLLEVDEGLLSEMLTGGSVCFKGSADEEAVLCTSSKTYAVKTVETSNLVLLVQGSGEESSRGPLGSQDRNLQQADVQPTPPGVLVGLATQLQKNQAAVDNPRLVVTARVGSHLEVVPAGPRLATLDALLAERPYGALGADDEEEEEEAAAAAGERPAGPEAMEVEGSTGGSSGSSGRGLYSWEQLLARVQASEAELREALAARHALLLDGCYRSVDPGYLGTLLELILLTAVEQGWERGAIPAEQVAAALQQHGYDPRLTRHCLSVYGQPLDSGSSRDAQGRQDAADTYQLEEGPVCLHFAKHLLQQQEEWELGAFLDAWASCVPEGMTPGLDMLRGEALLLAGGSRLRSFPLSALPAEAEARFAALFAAQPRWEWPDLEPYVQGLQQPGQTAEALLLKYTRASQAKPTDPVTYSMR